MDKMTQGIYTKQFPFYYYGLVPVVIAAVMLAVYGHAVRSAANANQAATEQSASSAHAPQICRISADENITQCGNSVTLHVDQGVTNYTWSNNAVDPDMTVTHSGQYWWQFIDMARNTVTNGNFSNGKNGFSSDYTYISPTGTTGPYGALSAEGYYSVAASPRTTHTSFSAFADHTGSGNMMVINGSPQNNAVVWKQSITVEPNTSYIFSIWAASAHPSNPAKLTFSINGSQMGVIQLGTTTGVWQNFTVQWTSSSSTTATIGIVNQNTIASGNDFALDDIVFAPICRKYFNVTLDPNPPKPAITSN